MRNIPNQTTYQLPSDWTKENIDLWRRTFYAAREKYRIYSLFRRGDGVVDYAADVTVSSYHPAKVDPSDWRGSVYLLKRYLYGRRQLIFLIHFIAWKTKTETMGLLKMKSWKVFYEEVDFVQGVIGQKLLEFNLWPIRDEITQMGFFD